MNRFCLPLFLLSGALFAQETPAASDKNPLSMPPLNPSGTSKSTIVIESKGRAGDYVQAFEMLRKEKPTLKIMIRTVSGMVYSNVTDLTAAQNGTLLLMKVLSNQGTKLQILPVEELMEMTYS
ncbi:MAG: hypothetical protein V4487_00955 [Chlamydiota bacterium]